MGGTSGTKVPVLGIMLVGGLLLGPAEGDAVDGSYSSHITIEPDKGEAGAVDLPITITADYRVRFTRDARITFSPAAAITVRDLEASENVLTAKITIPPDTPGQVQAVHVEEDRLNYYGYGQFEIVVQEILSVQPDSGPAGDGFSVTIRGRNTRFDGSSVVTFSGQGILAGSATAVDEFTLELMIVVSPDAPRTRRDVTVTTGDKAVTGRGLFTVTPPPITITPAFATQGDAPADIQITGGPGGYTASTNVDLGEGIAFGSTSVPDGDSMVLFGVSAAANAPVGPHDLVLSSPAETYPGAFTVIQGPDTRLLSVTPDHADRGHPGLDVSFLGQNTNFDGDDPSVSFSAVGILVSDLVASDGEHLGARMRISDTTPEGAVDAAVSLRTGGCGNCERVVLDDAFDITPPGTLDRASPGAIGAGERATVSISATDGRFEDGRTVLVIEPGVGVAVTSLDVIDGDHLTAELEVSPDAWGYTRHVRAVTGTEVAVGLELIDILRPEIRYVVPSVIYQGDVLKVTITGVDIPFGDGTRVVISGSGVAARWVHFDPQRPDQIEALISVKNGAPLGRRDLTVIAGDTEITLPEALLVKPASASDGGGGCSCGGRPLTSLLFALGVVGLLLSRHRRAERKRGTKRKRETEVSRSP